MKQMHKILILFIAILFSLGGCKIGKNYSKYEVETPDTYRYLNDTAGVNEAINWWSLFQDPLLDTLIRQALISNRDLLITAQNVEQAKLGLSVQKAEMLPKINITGQAQRGNFQGMKLDEPINNFLLGGGLSWEIDFWGKLRRMNEAAKAEYLASQYGLQSLRISLISTVATTYFQLLESRERLEIAENTLKIRESSLDIIKQRFEAGIIPEIDVNHSEIQRAIAATSIPFYKRQAAQVENYLAMLVGALPHSITSDNSLEEVIVNPTIPAGLPSQLLERRPDVLGAEQALIAQNAMVGVSQANRLPSISLTGMLGGASNDLSTLTSGGAAWNIGGSILGPLFHWNQNSRRVKIEESRLKAMAYNYEHVVLNAFREVEDALIAITTYKEELVAYEQRQEAAVNAMELSGQRYDKGVAAYIEYLESQRQAFDAQLGLVGAKQQLISSYVQLYKALGGGWTSEGEAMTE
jgi:multidrug efflux system outer membrane protein